MSGGYFDYKQHHIRDIADEIERVIAKQYAGEDRLDDKTIDRFIEGVKALRIAEAYTQRIDWLLSGDDGEATFWERIEADLKDNKQ